MNGQAVLTAMIPEHILLLGIVLLILLEMYGKKGKDTLVLPLCVVTAAAGAALYLCWAGYAASPFPGQLSVDPAIFSTKLVVLLLALPVLLISRQDFAGHKLQ